MPFYFQKDIYKHFFFFLLNESDTTGAILKPARRPPLAFGITHTNFISQIRP